MVLFTGARPFGSAGVLALSAESRRILGWTWRSLFTGVAVGLGRYRSPERPAAKYASLHERPGAAKPQRGKKQVFAAIAHDGGFNGSGLTGQYLCVGWGRLARLR